MNENEQALRYNTLMSEYTRLENMIQSVPMLSLDEQMKQVDITTKVLYSPENQKLVNQYKTRMASIQQEVMNTKII